MNLPSPLLQDPQSAIPKGTLLAIVVTGITYIAVTLSTGKLTRKNVVRVWVQFPMSSAHL